MALVKDLDAAKLFPYLSGALVTYEVRTVYTHNNSTESTCRTGIVTDVKYMQLGSGKLVYAILHITSGWGIAKLRHNESQLRILQLADGTSFRKDTVLSTSHLTRVLSKLWCADQKRLLSDR